MFFIIIFGLCVFIGFVLFIVYSKCKKKNRENELLFAIKLCANNNTIKFDQIEYLINTGICHSTVFYSSSTSLTSSNVINDMLLIHGANTYPSYWFDSVPILVSAGYRVHCLALPGFGLSTTTINIEKTSSKQVLQLIIGFIDQYINKNMSTKPILIGHSFGGYLATWYTVKYPNKISHLILSNSTGIYPLAGNNSFYWLIVFKYGIFIMDQIVNPENIGHKMVSKFMDVNILLGSGQFKHNNIHKLVTNIVPITFIWGIHDIILPIYCARRTYQLLNKIVSRKILFYEINTGHNSMIYGSKDFSNIVVLACSTMNPSMCKSKITFKQKTQNKSKQIQKNMKMLMKNIYANWSIKQSDTIICNMYEKINEIL